MKLIECVPNFSEGKDESKIRAIAEAFASVQGVTVLDVDMGADANRSVMTIAGPPESIVEAGFRGIAEASRRIDMRIQQGAHPRIGATDVVPLIPIHGSTMEECIHLSRQLGERVGRELAIPVYLYGEAAETGNRKKLSAIRAGGFESLESKMREPTWKPDFGPLSPNEKAGAAAIGARPLLIALNINLDTRDLTVAKRIAAEMRESGRQVRVGDKTKRLHGLLKACQAIGWDMPGYGRTQVSTNLTDFRMTPPHTVYETCKLLAVKYGTTAAGCEPVGMIPNRAMLMAGRHYAEKEGMSIDKEGDLIALAAEAMGFNSVRPFDPTKKILEYRIQELMGISVDL
jgi:glutamate formiminotransferase/formiminotetrahydrofolate cyclodeaminase